MADLVHLERLDEEGTVNGEAWIVPERIQDLLCIPIWRIAADDPRASASDDPRASASGAASAPADALPPEGDDDDAAEPAERRPRGAHRTSR